MAISAVMLSGLGESPAKGCRQIGQTGGERVRGGERKWGMGCADVALTDWTKNEYYLVKKMNIMPKKMNQKFSKMNLSLKKMNRKW